MSKKKKNRQNDTSRGQSSAKNDKSRRVLKMTGHLLLARNEAAAALLRAALKEIEQHAVPEVKHSHNSFQAFKQFLSFSGLFWKNLFQTLKVHLKSDIRYDISPERASEQFSAAAKACGKAFVSWIGLLLAEIWTVIALAFGTLFRFIWKLLSWCGFQIVRFFRYLKKRLFWKRLKYDIRNRALKEDHDKKSAERKAEREEQRAKKREEAEFRKALKAEEEAFQKAKQKEEEAIRIAKERREEAARMTERIESELAALALKRKEEEDKVLLETKRKEEAMAALSEANSKAEAERIRLEEQRRIEEEARIEAEKQEAEATRRLAEMQEAEKERIRKAEEENRLKIQKAASESVSEPEPKQDETVAELEVKEETAVLNETEASEPAEDKPAAEGVANEASAEVVTETEEETQAAEAAPEQPSEVTAVPVEPVQNEAEETLHEDAGKAAEQLEKELDEAEEAYLESRRRKHADEAKKKGKEKGIPASAAHTAVRTLPVHIPTISVPENLDARELITEARDNTNGIIYRVVKALELPQAAASMNTALLAGAVKYTAIAFAMSLCSMIGTAGHEGTPGFGTSVLMFFVIAIVGTLLGCGLSWLCGLLVMKKTGGTDNAVFLKQNSVYVPISALAYILCALILIFNRGKFVAVLIAVILLSVIGHLMVLFRENGVTKGYLLLIYLLCIVITAAVAVLLLLMFSSQLHQIWNALL